MHQQLQVTYHPGRNQKDIREGGVLRCFKGTELSLIIARNQSAKLAATVVDA